MIIFNKNVINVDVARSLKLLSNCNIFSTCWYDIRIDDILLQQTLLIHIHGAVISSLHRVATASVNSYTLNIAQVNPFMKVVLRRQKIMFSFVLVQIWFGLPFFCLKTNILYPFKSIFTKGCVILIRFQVVMYDKNLIINSTYLLARLIVYGFSNL